MSRQTRVLVLGNGIEADAIADRLKEGNPSHLIQRSPSRDVDVAYVLCDLDFTTNALNDATESLRALRAAGVSSEKIVFVCLDTRKNDSLAESMALPIHELRKRIIKSLRSLISAKGVNFLVINPEDREEVHAFAAASAPVIKSTLIGLPASGKSTLMDSLSGKYALAKSDRYVPTMGVGHQSKKSVSYKDKSYSLSLRDTAGDKLFSAITSRHLEANDVVYLVATASTDISALQEYYESLEPAKYGIKPEQVVLVVNDVKGSALSFEAAEELHAFSRTMGFGGTVVANLSTPEGVEKLAQLGAKVYSGDAKAENEAIEAQIHSVIGGFDLAAIEARPSSEASTESFGDAGTDITDASSLDTAITGLTDESEEDEAVRSESRSSDNSELSFADSETEHSEGVDATAEILAAEAAIVASEEADLELEVARAILRDQQEIYRRLQEQQKAEIDQALEGAVEAHRQAEAKALADSNAQIENEALADLYANGLEGLRIQEQAAEARATVFDPLPQGRTTVWDFVVPALKPAPKPRHDNAASLKKTKALKRSEQRAADLLEAASMFAIKPKKPPAHNISDFEASAKAGVVDFNGARPLTGLELIRSGSEIDSNPGSPDEVAPVEVFDNEHRRLVSEDALRDGEKLAKLEVKTAKVAVARAQRLLLEVQAAQHADEKSVEGEAQALALAKATAAVAAADDAVSAVVSGAGDASVAAYKQVISESDELLARLDRILKATSAVSPSDSVGSLGSKTEEDLIEVISDSDAGDSDAEDSEDKHGTPDISILKAPAADHSPSVSGDSTLSESSGPDEALVAEAERIQAERLVLEAEAVVPDQRSGLMQEAVALAEKALGAQARVTLPVLEQRKALIEKAVALANKALKGSAVAETMSVRSESRSTESSEASLIPAPSVSPSDSARSLESALAKLAAVEEGLSVYNAEVAHKEHRQQMQAVHAELIGSTAAEAESAELDRAAEESHRMAKISVIQQAVERERSYSEGTSSELSDGTASLVDFEEEEEAAPLRVALLPVARVAQSNSSSPDSGQFGPRIATVAEVVNVANDYEAFRRASSSDSLSPPLGSPVVTGASSAAQSAQGLTPPEVSESAHARYIRLVGPTQRLNEEGKFVSRTPAEPLAAQAQAAAASPGREMPASQGPVENRLAYRARAGTKTLLAMEKARELLQPAAGLVAGVSAVPQVAAQGQIGLRAVTTPTSTPTSGRSPDAQGSDKPVSAGQTSAASPRGGQGVVAFFLWVIGLVTSLLTPRSVPSENTPLKAQRVGVTAGNGSVGREGPSGRVFAAPEPEVRGPVQSVADFIKG